MLGDFHRYPHIAEQETVQGGHLFHRFLTRAYAEIQRESAHLGFGGVRRRAFHTFREQRKYHDLTGEYHGQVAFVSKHLLPRFLLLPLRLFQIRDF